MGRRCAAAQLEDDQSGGRPAARGRRPLTPVTIVSGFLGVGKTTAIRDLFARHRPEDERWAVLVNEFGEIGIDGAAMSGLLVEEIPGGCICCGQNMALQVALVQLLKEVNPDRLLIEPTGLAHPATIIDLLRQLPVEVRATICLTNPSHFLDSRYTGHDAWLDQLALADIVVANHGDVATEEELKAFQDRVATLYPPPVEVAVTAHGVLDPAWLELDPVPQEVHHHHHDHDHHHHDHVAKEIVHGWVYPAERVFDREKLETVLQRVVRPGELMPDGVLRLKGVFRTQRGWLLVNASADRIKWEPIVWRRDSRVELIALEAGDADAIGALLEDCKWVRPKARPRRVGVTPEVVRDALCGVLAPERLGDVVDLPLPSAADSLDEALAVKGSAVWGFGPAAERIVAATGLPRLELPEEDWTHSLHAAVMAYRMPVSCIRDLQLYVALRECRVQGYGTLLTDLGAHLLTGTARPLDAELRLGASLVGGSVEAVGMDDRLAVELAKLQRGGPFWGVTAIAPWIAASAFAGEADLPPEPVPAAGGAEWHRVYRRWLVPRRLEPLGVDPAVRDHIGNDAYDAVLMKLTSLVILATLR